MRHEDVKRHNAWCAWLESAAYAAARDAASQRLSRVLDCPVSLRAEACCAGEAGRPGGLLFGTPFSVEVKTPAGGRAVVAATRLFPSLALRLVTGSEKLAVSTAFCGAALELVVLHAVAAWPGLSETPPAVERPSTAGPPPAGTERCTRFRVTMTAGGESADLFVCVPASMRPPEPTARTRAGDTPIPAAVCLGVAPIEIARLRDLMPGDVVTLDPGASDAPILSIPLGDGLAIEWLIDAGAFSQNCEVRISSEPQEVFMNGAKIANQPGEPGAPVPRALDDLKLPARLEVAAFDLPVGEVARLAPGQVIAWKDGSARTVKMFVCGTLFAEGTIETHEGFHGFRVEKIH